MSTVAPVYTPSGEGGNARRWTRDEFRRAADLGLFRPDERLELIDGEVIVKLTQNPPYTRGVMKTARALGLIFGEGYTIRQQMPMAVGTRGEPEPDILVVPGGPDDYDDHPTPADAVLLVEVADRTLRYDMGRKAAYYAEAGIRDYWVLDLTHRRLIVHRDLAAEGRASHYADVRTLNEGETVAPLAAPGKLVPVSDLLPL